MAVLEQEQCLGTHVYYIVYVIYIYIYIYIHIYIYTYIYIYNVYLYACHAYTFGKSGECT